MLFSPLVRALAVVLLGPSLVLAASNAAATPARTPAAGSVTTPRAASPTDGGGRDTLERLADEVVDAGVPGVVLARRTGGGLTVAARGVADLRTGRPARPGDRYRIGSVTKTMVAVVVLQLVAERQLSLDDRVATWLPGLGLDERITVRNLLQQTSGFRTDTRVFSPPRSYESNRFRYFRPEELVEIALTNPAPRPAPGTHWEYSNTNYVLAGLLVEKVTGRSVRAELRRRIFRPLGLTGTSFPEASPVIAGRHLRGYLPGGPGQPWVDTTVYSVSWAWAAGAVVSTARDETAFLRALMSGRLLPDRLLDVMLDAGEWGYGLGIYPYPLACAPGGVVWGHNGMVFGYHSAVFSTSDGSRQASIGANAWLVDETGALDPIAEQAAAAALCDTPPRLADLAQPRLHKWTSVSEYGRPGRERSPVG
jgi:D-alanyl-D-alanine carboxypeptidase